MSIAQRLYEGVETREGQVGLITYMRTDSTAIAGRRDGRGPRGDRRALRRASTRCPRAASTRRSRRAPRRRTSRSARRASGATPTRSRARSSPRSCASTGSSGSARWPRRWRPRSSRPRRSSWPTAPTSCGRSATQGPVRRLRPRLHRGSRRRRRRRRGDRPAAGARRPATGRRSRTSRPTQHFTEPPPRFTEATLIKALEEHGIGRPSTYAATISTIVDRGYVRVEERRLRPEPVAEIVTDLLVEHFGDYVDVDVHRPDGGGARRGRPRRARVGPAAARVLRPAARPGRREAARAQAQRLHDRGDRRGLLARPPDGHPARAQRAVPGLLALSRSTRRAGRCPATSRRPRRGPARSARSAARARSSASAAGSGRSSAARATRTATTSRRTARRRPTRCRSR